MRAHHTFGSLAQGMVLVATTVVATVSYNSQCGVPSKFTCVGSLYGDCCSANGFCGSTEDHCGAGCQSEYGFCDGKKQPELKIRGYGRCQHGWTPTGLAFEELPKTAAGDLGANAVKPSVTATISVEETLTAPPGPVFTEAPTEAQPTQPEPTDFVGQTDSSRVEPTPTISEVIPDPIPASTSPSSGGSTELVICQGADDTQCIDNFLIGCDRALPVDSVPFCDNNLATDDQFCQELCLNDEDCTGWSTSLSGGDTEAGGVPDFDCCLYRAPLVLIPTATPRPTAGYDWGIRNAC
ncbi:hypothetical protein BJ166DRAFT_63901 [Pestalotiopsis sp. NC0098]|nr:hypothetical protein BJ166DRAFT_63901 [Pestalotiopsis sp. NC0098]